MARSHNRDQHGGDLSVAVAAVHNVCNLLHVLLSTHHDPQYMESCAGTRFSPLELAAQALLMARIKRHLPYDSFISEFRDQAQSQLSVRDISRIIHLISFAERGLAEPDRDYTLHRENTVRAYLDGGGKIHRGGINPHARRHGSGGSNEPQHAMAPSDPSDAGRNVNRVWVLQPLDDLEAAKMRGAYCVGATLFQNGEQALTVIGVPNWEASGDQIEDCLSSDVYGTMFTALKGHGAFTLHFTLHEQTLMKPLRLTPRDPAQDDLEGHKAFQRVDVAIPMGQELEARGKLTPREILPPQRQLPPTSPRAFRERRVAAQPPSDQPYDPTIPKTDMVGTGPTMGKLLADHVNMAHRMRTSLLSYIAVANGSVHAYVSIPLSTTANLDTPIWKEAGGSLLVQEAGGMVTDAEGAELDFTTGRTLRKNFGILAACPGLTHWRLTDAIRGYLVVTGETDGPEGPGVGRWTRARSFGPWHDSKGRGHGVTEDVGGPGVWPRDGQDRFKQLRTRVFRPYAEWPRARATWQPGAVTGAWVREAGGVKKSVQPGHTAGARYLPDCAKSVPHAGPCMWPCASCEPQEHQSWYKRNAEGS